MVSKDYAQNLTVLVEQSINSGISDKGSLLHEMKYTATPKSIYEKLGKDLEQHHVNDNLEKLGAEKDQAKSNAEIIQALGKEQKFLAGLHGKIQYPEEHVPGLLKSIEQAHKNEQDHVMVNLGKLTNHLEQRSFIDKTALSKALRETTYPKQTHKSLLEDYHTKVMDIATHHINPLMEGKMTRFDGKDFRCPMKFMEHINKEYGHNEFMPHKELHKLHEHAIEHHKEMEFSKNMSGPSF